MRCFLIAFQVGLERDAVPIGDVHGIVDRGLAWYHFIYSCDSFAGDSGGEIIVRNGRVFGVHQETVNEARERKDKLVGDDLIEDLSLSVKSFIDSSSTGSIGFLISAIHGNGSTTLPKAGLHIGAKSICMTWRSVHPPVLPKDSNNS